MCERIMEQGVETHCGIIYICKSIKVSIKNIENR